MRQITYNIINIDEYIRDRFAELCKSVDTLPEEAIGKFIADSVRDRRLFDYREERKYDADAFENQHFPDDDDLFYSGANLERMKKDAEDYLEMQRKRKESAPELVEAQNE